MRFDIITSFPELIEFYSNHSILKRAQKEKKIEIKIHNLRDFAEDKHQKIDDRSFGGGGGMVFKIEPLFKALISLRIPFSKLKINFNRTKSEKIKIILFTPRGKKFNQKLVYQYSQLDRLVLICGRYEGIDERILKYLSDENISIGNYVLLGGELPALIVLEAVSRLLPGVIKETEFLSERISNNQGFIEYPQYTRPEIFDPLKFLTQLGVKVSKVKKETKWQVPKILISGNHQEIKKWRQKHQKIIN